MKKLAAGQLMAMVVAFSGSTAFAGNVGVDFNIHVGRPVQTANVREYEYREPVRSPVVEEVRFVYPRELGFRVAVGVPYDLCSIDNSYYMYRGGRWLRATSSQGPWVVQRNRDLPWDLRKHRIDRIRYYRDIRHETPVQFPDRHRGDHYPAYRERHDCDKSS